MALYTGCVDDFIIAARNDSRNTDKPDGSDNIGFQDSDFVRYLNFAQESLQTIILKANPGAFKKEVIIPVVPGVEEYTVPDRVFSGERIINIQFSFDGLEQNYQDLRQIGENYRKGTGWYGSVNSYPSAYVRRSSSFIIYPTTNLSTATLRVVYERQLDTLCLRVAQIGNYDANAKTLTLSGVNAEYENYLLPNSYICVSDPDGEVILRNAKVASFTPPTLTLVDSLSGSLVDGATLTQLTGSYVTLGKYTTTHTKLNQVAWRYLSEYACIKAFQRDSSSDVDEARITLSKMEKEILDVYQDANRDEMEVQLINPHLVINDDFFGWGR